MEVEPMHTSFWIGCATCVLLSVGCGPGASAAPKAAPVTTGASKGDAVGEPHLTRFSRPPVLQGMSPIEYYDLLAAGDAAFEGKQWSEAAKSYDRLLRAFAYNGEVWRRLGVTRENLNDFAGAADAYAQADQWGLTSYAFVNAADAARAYARAGRPEDAVRWLRAAVVTLNHPSGDALLDEKSYDSIRSSAPFTRFRAERSARKAETRMQKWSADIDLFLREFRDLRRDLGPQEWSAFREAAEALKKNSGRLSDHDMLAQRSE